MSRQVPGVHHLGFERHDLDPEETAVTLSDLGAVLVGSDTNQFEDLGSRLGLRLELATAAHPGETP